MFFQFNVINPAFNKTYEVGTNPEETPFLTSGRININVSETRLFIAGAIVKNLNNTKITITSIDYDLNSGQYLNINFYNLDDVSPAIIRVQVIEAPK